MEVLLPESRAGLIDAIEWVKPMERIACKMELAPQINADDSLGETQGQKITTSLFLPLGNFPLEFIAWPEIIETFALPPPIEKATAVDHELQASQIRKLQKY